MGFFCNLKEKEDNTVKEDFTKKIIDIKKDINILEDKIKNIEEKNKQIKNSSQKKLPIERDNKKSNSKENIKKDKKDKIKKKYNKQDKPNIIKEMQYYEDYNDKQIWKYSIHSYNKNFTIIYYNCLDSKCKARAILKFNKDDKNMNNDINRNNFTLSQDHNISYENHSYNKLIIIKNDLETKSINEIKNKLL